MKPSQEEMFEAETSAQPIEIFTDGAGARPDGKGSGYAFFRTDTGENQIIREDDLTNNQAEYKGVLLALESLPGGTAVKIRSDSTLVCGQLNGEYAVRDSKLISLWTSVQEIIRKKSLKVTFVWVRRQENLAGKLL